MMFLVLSSQQVRVNAQKPSMWMDNSDKQTSKQTNQQNKKKLKSLEISVAYCCPKPLPLTVRHHQENPMPLEHQKRQYDC